MGRLEDHFRFGRCGEARVERVEVNVGGNFRIVGGVPDQRVDIQGAFTGAKK